MINDYKIENFASSLFIDLLERMQTLEDTARHLTDFNENLRNLEHGLQRCEDKLASHDALGGAAKDPKLLDRIKVIHKWPIRLKSNR